MERKTMVEMIEKAIREASELDPGMRITEDRYGFRRENCRQLKQWVNLPT